MKKNQIKVLKTAFSGLILLISYLATGQCAAPASAIVNNTHCSTPNGRITFTAPTPTANYLFSIDGGISYGAAGQTVFTGLFGGDYPTVSKNISSGCVSTTVIRTLTNPASPAPPTSAIINNTNCNTPNGRITFSAPAPTANYRFSIDGGVTFGTPGQTVFSGLTGGSYPTVAKLISTDCNSAIVVKTITNPVVTAPTSTVLNVTNCNTPNGRITFTAPTPLANYQFSINNGVSFGAPGVAVFSNLAAGTYITRAKLVSTGCISAAVNKVIANPAIAAPVSTVTNVTNCNTPNGRITFTAPTPLANYQFSINNGVSFGAPGVAVFSGLSAGTYITRVKLISTGCISAAASKVISNPTVTAPTSTLLNPTSCITPNGRITFTGPTPLANYQFSVNGGASFGTSGQTVFNGLAAGTYSTRAKLISSGCVSAPVNKVLTNPVVAVPVSTTTTSSCSTPTGSITFTGPTPTANYVFSVDDGATFGTSGQTVFSGLAAGVYATKSKLISSGCISATVNKTITNTVVTAPTSTVTNLTNCNTPNGSITFTGPAPVTNYQFSVDGGTTFGTTGQTLFSGLDDGTYSTVAKLVSSGCESAVVSKVITRPVVTAPTSTVSNVTNCAAPNGSITFTAPTPVANYQFSVDGGASFGAAGVTVFSGLQHGVYPTVSKLVSSGCVSVVVNKTVTAPVLAGADKSICLNQSVAMSATAAAGASWTEQAGNPAPTTIATPASATTTISGFSVPGTYNFIWQNSTCADTTSVEVADCSSPLACSNFGYLFQSLSGSGTDFITVNLRTGAHNTLYTDMTTNPVGINAIGYNVTDGHIWGSVVGGPVSQIARVGANGVPVYFTISGLLATGFNVGTVDDNGVLYLYTSNTTDIYRVDVNPSSPTYLTLLSPVLTTIAMSIADWAYNPVDNFLYGVSTNGAAPRHQLLRVNPNTGGVTVVGTVTSTHANFDPGSFGAAYLDANGNLYVSDNIAGGIYKLPVVQNIFTNTTAQFFSQGAISSGNDGALCHFACVKPDAGRDSTVCSTGTVTMTATSASGIQWIAQDDNPGTSVIADSSDANTTINGFSAPGTYNYIWNNGGLCGDTASIFVYDCIVDTVVGETGCDTITVCGTAGSIPPSATTTYTTCGLTPQESTKGSLTIDENGCAVWTPNGQATDTITTCVATCNDPICDTTFMIITPCVPGMTLPVTLVYFTGNASGCMARLTWGTASEENSAWFDIERNTGDGWRYMQRVTAAGNSYGQLNYDASIPLQTGLRNSVRLRMVDKDGRTSFSNVMALQCDNKQSITIGPSPVTSQLLITGLSGSNDIRISDEAGRMVRYMKANGSSHEINTGNFSNGIYFVEVISRDGTRVASKKIVKQ